jgi:C_GCAxxG_C_C family probable redox protein
MSVFTPEEAAARAQRRFDDGCNCAESVFSAFLEGDVPFSPESVCLATGFGGGMGATHKTCGAVTGAIMAMGLYLGRRDPLGDPDHEASHAAMQREIYPVFGDMVCKMEQELGTLVCAELTSGHEGPGRRAHCRGIVGACASLCAKQIADALDNE